MSLPRELARLAVGTLSTTLDAVRLVIWVPLGLLLFVGIAVVVFAPVLEHMRTYWWVYLAAIVTFVAVVVFLVSRDASRIGEAAQAVSQPAHSLSQAELAASQVEKRTTREQSSGGRPTSGHALFRFTEEWIDRHGLYEGRDMPKVDAVKIAGRTAIFYHLREGNFVEREGRLALTAKGKTHFANRRSRL
jgi:hypothetical protein